MRADSLNAFTCLDECFGTADNSDSCSAHNVATNAARRNFNAATTRHATTFAITAMRPRYRLDVNPVSSSDYDLAPDGRVIANGGEADPSPVTVVANWR